ncbi:MAG TPA: hypothetical protein PKG71_02915 [Candidatus Woesebacteria bacterium]|nr:hypothetical protein [Candidatus Woesebacteria bacterium]HNS94893.1 hypothetical protein [Candidatus Woesebacteria bacterium]
MGNQEAKHRLRILQIYGSEGMPSCGMTDAARIGQDGNAHNATMGGSETYIAPGTPVWEMPTAVVHRIAPGGHSKSPRNMRKFLQKRSE